MYCSNSFRYALMSFLLSYFSNGGSMASVGLGLGVGVVGVLGLKLLVNIDLGLVRKLLEVSPAIPVMLVD